MPGNYRLATFAIDSSGNIQNTYNGVKFKIAGSDTTKPTSQIARPAQGTVQSESVEMSGSASDDVQVARVMLSIKNLDLQKNWNGSSFQSGEAIYKAPITALDLK